MKRKVVKKTGCNEILNSENRMNLEWIEITALTILNWSIDSYDALFLATFNTYMNNNALIMIPTKMTPSNENILCIPIAFPS